MCLYSQLFSPHCSKITCLQDVLELDTLLSPCLFCWELVRQLEKVRGQSLVLAVPCITAWAKSPKVTFFGALYGFLICEGPSDAPKASTNPRYSRSSQLRLGGRQTRQRSGRVPSAEVGICFVICGLFCHTFQERLPNNDVCDSCGLGGLVSFYFAR